MSTGPSLSFQDVRAANLRRVPEFGHGGLEEWDVPRWFMAMTGEVGELGNLLKKIERGDFHLGEAHVREAVAHEIADIALYLDLLAARLGVDLEESIVEKFNIVSRRIQSDVTLNPGATQ